MNLLKSTILHLMALAIVLAVAMGAPAEAQSANTAGQHVFASAVVADGSGVTTTVATTGTYVTVGTAAPLAAGEADGSGCITYTLATNRFTIAKRCGVGIVLLTACIDDATGLLSKTWTGAWHRIRASTPTLQGPIIRRTEAATAIRESHGCVNLLVDAQLGDTYDFRYDSSANADTVVTRHASFIALKLFSK
jgi:hypothetical protein